MEPAEPGPDVPSAAQARMRLLPREPGYATGQPALARLPVSCITNRRKAGLAERWIAWMSWMSWMS